MSEISEMKRNCQFCNNPNYTKLNCEKKVQIASKEHVMKNIDLTNDTNGSIKSEETKHEEQVGIKVELINKSPN